MVSGSYKKELIRFCLLLCIPIVIAILLNVIPFSPPYGSDVVESNQWLDLIVILFGFMNIPGIDFAVAVLCATRRQACEKLGLIKMLLLVFLFGFLGAFILVISVFSCFQVCLYATVHLAVVIPITLIRFWRYKRSISPKTIENSDQSTERPSMDN